jgi:hypothetical protein
MTPPINLVIGGDVPGPRGTIAYYGVPANTELTLVVEDKNADGTPSETANGPLDMFVDINNMGTAP